MKSLVEYILESRIDESLSSSWLQKLMKAIKEKGIKNAKLTNLSGWGKDIRWDKVTDEYFKEYEAGDTEAVKVTRKIIKRDLEGLVILVDKDNEVFGTIANGGFVTTFMKAWDESWHKYQRVVDRQYEALDFVKAYKTVIYTFKDDADPQKVIININDKDSKLQRNLSKTGIVLQGDAEYYQELARENVKRYKNIVAQNKVKKLDDDISKRVKEAVDKVMEITLEMESNPEKYRLTYNIDYLLNLLYTTKYYDNKSNSYKGTNGLLPLWKSYLKDKTKASKDSQYADMHYKRAKTAKEEIENVLKKIEEVIKKIK